MREDRLADAFDRQVGAMLPAPREEERYYAEVKEAVDMARELAHLDLTDESRIRDSLEERLTRLAAGRETGSRPGGGRRVRVLRPALVGAFLLALVVAGLAILSPSSLAALSQILERIWIGENTSVIRPSPRTELEVEDVARSFREKLDAGESWNLSTPYGGFGGRVPPADEPVIKQVASLRIADSLTDFSLLAPTYVPPPEVPPELRFRYAQIAPGGWTFLFFNGGPFEVMLAQVAVGSGTSVTSSQVVSRTGPDGARVVESAEIRAQTLNLDGQELLWRLNPESDDVGMLIWEAHGVSYTLAGRSLTRDEAVKIYRSLEPIG